MSRIILIAPYTFFASLLLFHRMRNFFQHFEFVLDNLITMRGHANGHWESQNFHYKEDFFWVPFLHKEEFIDVSCVLKNM
jgi:hypothetical protein